MSTNGTLLADAAHDLACAGLSRVNISLDTLDPETYASITGKNLLEDVLSGLDAALDAGLTPVKLNMVVLAGLNGGEIERMIDYSSNRGAILQLIELMKMPAGEQLAFRSDIPDARAKRQRDGQTGDEQRRRAHQRRDEIAHERPACRRARAGPSPSA